ncbi:UNVERIFIED_CONTAM: hypothetical protein BEN50_25675 [Euhalothece sp. KZN 001]
MPKGLSISQAEAAKLVRIARELGLDVGGLAYVKSPDGSRRIETVPPPPEGLGGEPESAHDHDPTDWRS